MANEQGIGPRERLARALRASLVILSAMTAFPGIAGAQPRDLEPGSLLVYPFFDNRPGRETVVTVTNTNFDRSVTPNGFKTGDVLAHFVYVDGLDCLEFDRAEFLTPGDTLTVPTTVHDPHAGFGFLYVYATDPETHEPIEFDHLLGDILVIASGLEGGWSIQAVAFQAFPGGPPGPAAPTSGSGHAFTDADGDGLRDFDGIEYDLFPDALYVPRFFEEGARNQTQLVLVTPFGPEYIASAEFSIFNNSEDRFSRSLRFSCWFAADLSTISSITSSLGGNPFEFAPRQTGWLRIAGGRLINRSGRREPFDTAVLGFALENLGPVGNRIQVARLLNHSGTRFGGSLR